MYRGYFPSLVNGKEGFDISDPKLDSCGNLLKLPYHEINVFPQRYKEDFNILSEEYFKMLHRLGNYLFSVVKKGTKVYIRA